VLFALFAIEPWACIRHAVAARRAVACDRGCCEGKALYAGRWRLRLFPTDAAIHEYLGIARLPL